MAPRTKACAICRKKRIKCDLTLPQCLMCIRTNKQCPGPIEGPLIIDMSSSTAKKSQDKKGLLNAYGNPLFSDTAIGPGPLLYDIVNRMNRGPVLNEAFYSKFLLYFTSDGEGRDLQNRMTWLHKLPDLSNDGTNAALNLSIRASAAAFCGVETGNLDLLQSAWKLYGKALTTHARTLNSKPKEVTVHMVSTSVMLSLFEAMQATSADAYRNHINGAAKMIEVTGPGQCFAGVLCQLFFHIRTQMAFVYLTTHIGQALPVKKILIENLSYQRLPIFQRLMSHIATLAEIYVDKTSAKSQQQLINLEVYEGVKREIDTLWADYNDQAIERNEPLTHMEGEHKAFRDPFTALTIAYFSAARILFTVLAPRLACSYVDFTDHYAEILICAQFLRARNIGCAYMRMATPLYLVALHGPKLEMRREATGIFETWKKGSMAGISALALDTIRKRAEGDLGVLDGQAWEEEVQPVQNLPLGMFAFEDWVAQM